MNSDTPVLLTNALEAPPGVSTIEVRSSFTFRDGADKSAFLAHLGLASQIDSPVPAKVFLAGPVSGEDATPDYRTLGEDDLPEDIARPGTIKAAALAVYSGGESTFPAATLEMQGVLDNPITLIIPTVGSGSLLVTSPSDYQLELFGSGGVAGYIFPAGGGTVQVQPPAQTLSEIQTTAPLFVGEVRVSSDGFQVHGTGTGVGDWITDWYYDGTATVRPLRDLYSTNGNATFDQGYLRASSPSGEHVLSIQSGAAVNTLILNRPDDGFYNAIQYNIAGVERAAVGYGTPSAGSYHFDKLFMEVGKPNGAASDVDMKGWLVAQYNVYGSINYFPRLELEPNGDFFVWQMVSGQPTNDTGPVASPVSIFSKASGGQVGIKTTTLTSNAELTVNGAISSKQQRWHASKRGGSAQTLPAATWTDVTFSNEEFDSFNIFASNAATPTMPGVVHMNVSVYFGNIGTGSLCLVRITKNGTSMIEVIHTGKDSTDNHSISFSYFTDTDGNDEFKVQAYQGSGGDVGGETHFQGWVQ